MYHTVPETLSETSCCLQLLCKHFILPNIIVCDRTASEFHSILKVVLSDLGNSVILFHILINRLYTLYQAITITDAFH